LIWTIWKRKNHVLYIWPMQFEWTNRVRLFIRQIFSWYSGKYDSAQDLRRNQILHGGTQWRNPLVWTMILFELCCCILLFNYLVEIAITNLCYYSSYCRMIQWFFLLVFYVLWTRFWLYTMKHVKPSNV